ncbi:DUF3786 domain-containing protein [Desulfococcaceae bacterium HSG8]|nr:DUF3786 domain-containing protein [Desulfococcaceae bacterium HSG8]
MVQLKNVMDVFKLLNKSNCGDCLEKTCLAFAASVFKGQKHLDECPHLDEKIIRESGGNIEKQKTVEQDQEEIVQELKQKLLATDLSSAAPKVGGSFSNDQLTLKIFGKSFIVCSDGSLISDIHINPWVAILVITYVLDCEGLPVSGNWVPFRELKTGKIWQRLFRQRCEIPLKKVADTYTDLFEDLIRIFNGKQVRNHYESDISLVLHPLPRIPMLICYWRPGDGLESDLSLFFDSTAENNCGIEAIYALGTGFVRMIEKLSLRHG